MESKQGLMQARRVVNSVISISRASNVSWIWRGRWWRSSNVRQGRRVKPSCRSDGRSCWPPLLPSLYGYARCGHANGCCYLNVKFSRLFETQSAENNKRGKQAFASFCKLFHACGDAALQSRNARPLTSLLAITINCKQPFLPAPSSKQSCSIERPSKLQPYVHETEL